MLNVHSRRTAIVTITLLVALGFGGRADAGSVIFIDSCQTLSIPNTVYKLTQDVTAPVGGTCFLIAASRIMVDLQGHTVSAGMMSLSGVLGFGSADLAVIKNGTVSGFSVGAIVLLANRVSVLGVTVAGANVDGVNIGVGIDVRGDQALIKECDASSASTGIRVTGSRAQVQQCQVHGTGQGINVAANGSIVTMNIVDGNSSGISYFGNGTVSSNTVTNNSNEGIFAEATALITHNVASDNGEDYRIVCPSTITYNESTNGFPASYILEGDGCHTAHND